MAAQTATTALSVHHKPFFKSLYFQVLTAIVLGVLLGHYYPQLGLQSLGERGKALLGVIDQASHALFAVVGIIMKVAPIGAFGAMAFTIGKYGAVTLLSLAHLMVAFYVTCLVFIVFVLGGMAWLA